MKNNSFWEGLFTRTHKTPRPKNHFLIGMGSVLDLSGTYFKPSVRSSKNEGIRNDFDAVGADIRSAIDKIIIAKK